MNSNTSTNIFDIFETDNDLETSGVRIVYGTNSKGQPIQVTIARAGGSNVAFNKAYERITKPYRHQMNVGKLPKELNDRLNRELYAEAVVRSMSGFEERDGTSIDTSTKEGVMAMFERLPNLFSDIINQSQSMETFKSTQMEADAGN